MLALVSLRQPLSFCGGWWGGGVGLHSHFHVQPNYIVEVVTISICCISYHIILIGINGKDRY